MGFWKNTKLVVGHTLKTISAGADLIAQGGHYLERSSYQLLLSTKISALELERSRLGCEWFSESNREKHEELMSLYQKLLDELPPDQSSNVVKMKKQLDHDIECHKRQELTQRASIIERHIAKQNQVLAKIKIKDREQLIKVLSELIDNCDVWAHRKTIEDSRHRINKLKLEIEQLESERLFTVIELFPTGTKRIEYETLDGKKHGSYIEWYENGKIRWNLSFTDEKLINGKCFRSDGSPLFELKKFGKCAEGIVFSEESTPLISLNKNSTLITLSLLPEQLRGIKATQFVGRPISQTSLFLQVILSFKALKFFWASRSEGKERQLLKSIKLSIQEMELALTELEQIEKLKSPKIGEAQRKLNNSNIISPEFNKSSKSEETLISKAVSIERYSIQAPEPMVFNDDYWEFHEKQSERYYEEKASGAASFSSAILAEARSRQIKEIVHFTSLQNVSSIARHGILSIQDLKSKSIRCKNNDNVRLDARPHGISLSIGHPNSSMFYKYRMEEKTETWVVLSLNVNVLAKSCLFFPANAAKAAFRNIPESDFKGVTAFKKLFEGSEDRSLPADAQAEVMCLEPIGYHFVQAIYVQNINDVQRVKSILPTAKVIVDRKYFHSRRFR